MQRSIFKSSTVWEMIGACLGVPAVRTWSLCYFKLYSGYPGMQAKLYTKILTFHLQHHLLPSSVNADAFKVIQLTGLWAIKYPKTISRNNLTEGTICQSPGRAMGQGRHWGSWQGKAALSASTEHSLVDVLLLMPYHWSTMLITIACSLQNFMACMDRWIETWLASYRLNGNISEADVSENY